MLLLILATFVQLGEAALQGPPQESQEIFVSASGQPTVMRREAKEAERSGSQQFMEEHRIMERALHRAAEMGDPEDALYRESILKKVQDIVDHDVSKHEPAGLQQREVHREGAGATPTTPSHDVHGGAIHGDHYGDWGHGEHYMDPAHTDHYDSSMHTGYSADHHMDPVHVEHFDTHVDTDQQADHHVDPVHVEHLDTHMHTDQQADHHMDPVHVEHFDTHAHTDQQADHHMDPFHVEHLDTHVHTDQQADHHVDPGHVEHFDTHMHTDQQADHHMDPVHVEHFDTHMHTDQQADHQMDPVHVEHFDAHMHTDQQADHHMDPVHVEQDDVHGDHHANDHIEHYDTQVHDHQAEHLDPLHVGDLSMGHDELLGHHDHSLPPDLHHDPLHLDADHGILPHVGDVEEQGHDLKVHLAPDPHQGATALKDSEKAGVVAAEAALKIGLPAKKVAEVAATAARAAAQAEGMSEEQQVAVAEAAAAKAHWLGEEPGAVEHLEAIAHEASPLEHTAHMETLEHMDHLEQGPAHPVDHPMEDFQHMEHLEHKDDHLDNLEHPELMSFTLEGCDQELCKMMKGSYHEAGEKDGRPVYSKDGEEVSVFFADRGAKSGWWFARSLASDDAYAFHPGKDLLPPSSGWHVPPTGDVDASLHFLGTQVSDHFQYQPEEVTENMTHGVEPPVIDQVTITLAPSEEEMPTVQVLGCQDARTAAVVDGIYEAAGVSNGMPWFKKHGLEGSVWLYHYADVAAGSTGWWIGSNPTGRVHIYAFNPSQASFPPKSGWKAPWWGQVDAQMTVEAISEGHWEDDEAVKMAHPPHEEAANWTQPMEHAKDMPEAATPPMPTEAMPTMRGKELADMVFGTDTGVIPKEPPSEEMLSRLVEDPSLAKKALNQTVRMLGNAVRRLESGEAFHAEKSKASLQPKDITKHEQDAAVEGSAAAPLMKEVDQVAAAANEAAEKARLWKEAEIAEKNAKEAAEQAKKKVEKVTVQAAEQEAEKAIEDAADHEAASAKAVADQEAQKADAEVADREAQVAKAKKKIEALKQGASKQEKEAAQKELEEDSEGLTDKEEQVREAREALEQLPGNASSELRQAAEEALEKAKEDLKHGQEEVAEDTSTLKSMNEVTPEQKKVAEQELKKAQEAVKSAAMKADTLDKKADEIRLPQHNESEDNALYADSESSPQGAIVMGSEPKSDGERLLEAKLDAMQAKLEGLERVQLKEKLKDQLASLAESDATRIMAPGDVEKAEQGEASKAEKDEKDEKPKEVKKSSWNRVTIFVMAAIFLGGVAVGAMYQLVLVRRLSGTKAGTEETQPLMQEPAAASPANPESGAADPVAATEAPGS